MIGGGNSRKPVFGFRLSREGLFCKGLLLMVREDMAIDTQLEGQARLVAGYVLTVARPFGGRDSEKI